MKEKIEYPSHEEALAKLRELGGLTAVARSYGINSITFRHWRDRQGQEFLDSWYAVLDELKAADQKRRAVDAKSHTADDSVEENELLKARIKELEAANRSFRKETVAEHRIVQAFDDAFANSRVTYRA